ncbi:hypothetical protein HBB16_16055 [Pseudonocardia sp. MCCB 268]|nr:hypothetical protein [Pseudonocardia cytotoxica]
MTEIDGGTDVAGPPPGHRPRQPLTPRGRKWFRSECHCRRDPHPGPGAGQGEAPEASDVPGPATPAGRQRRNAIRIDRSADKLGTRSMASGEVTLSTTPGRSRSGVSRGFRQMAEMVNVSRLSNAMRSAAIMRRARCARRSTTPGRASSGRALFDQSSCGHLAPAAARQRGRAGAGAGGADRLDRRRRGHLRRPGSAGPSVDDDRARSLIRVLTPLAKYTVCKRARW